MPTVVRSGSMPDPPFDPAVRARRRNRSRDHLRRPEDRGGCPERSGTVVPRSVPFRTEQGSTIAPSRRRLLAPFSRGKMSVPRAPGDFSSLFFHSPVHSRHFPAIRRR